jgi:hypothetical protein
MIALKTCQIFSPLLYAPSSYTINAFCGDSELEQVDVAVV